MKKKSKEKEHRLIKCRHICDTFPVFSHPMDDLVSVWMCVEKSCFTATNDVSTKTCFPNFLKSQSVCLGYAVTLSLSRLSHKLMFNLVNINTQPNKHILNVLTSKCVRHTNLVLKSISLEH